jgi:hypothetical protein
MSRGVSKSAYEHLAGAGEVRGRVKRWPGAKITLRNGARIIEKTWPADD